MNSEPPRMVCFDLGGVLIRIRDSWAEAATSVGARPAPSESHHSAFQQARRAYGDQFQIGAISAAEHHASVAEASGGGYTAREIEAIHDAWTLDEYAGARALVRDLNAASVPTACLSNTNAPHWHRLTDRSGTGEYGVVNLLQTRLASQELNCAKPHTAIYEAAERAFGMHGGAIAFFDDRQENIQAATERGWRATLIDPRGDPPAQMRRWLQLNAVL